MSFNQNIKPILGTKKFEYSCMHCGIRKESYKTRTAKLKYCSTKCAAEYRKKPESNCAETERGLIGRYMPKLTTLASFLILMLHASLILHLIYGSKLRAADIEVQKIYTYLSAAKAMDTTYYVIKKIALLNADNPKHIDNVALGFKTKEFERSRTILSFEIQAFFYRNVKAWAEFCSD